MTRANDPLQVVAEIEDRHIRKGVSRLWRASSNLSVIQIEAFAIASLRWCGWRVRVDRRTGAIVLRDPYPFANPILRRWTENGLDELVGDGSGGR